jgi:hypothetical protein
VERKIATRKMLIKGSQWGENKKETKKTIEGRKESEGMERERSYNRITPYMVRSFFSENVFQLQVGDNAAEAGRILVILCRVQ